MSAYDELAGFRFTSGRDYDKRSVETFRARALNLVDDLLNQITTLRDEVAALRADGAEAPPAPPMVRIDLGESWLTASTYSSAFPPPASSALEAGDGRRGSAPTAGGLGDAGVDRWVSSIENATAADDERTTLGTVDLAPTPAWTDGEPNSGWSTTHGTSTTPIGAGGWDETPSTSSYDHNGWGDAPTTSAASAITVVVEPAATAAPVSAPSPFFAPIDLGEARSHPASTARLLGMPDADDADDRGRFDAPAAPARRATVVDDEHVIAAEEPSTDVDASPAEIVDGPIAGATTDGDDDGGTQLVPAGAVELDSDQANSPIVIDASPDEVGALPTPVRHWSGWLKK